MTPSRLQIQMNALERLKKERLLYSRDLQSESTVLEKMKIEGADAFDIKKQEELTLESSKMVKELDTKIANHKAKLSQLAASCDDDEHQRAAKVLLGET